jgi:hypothetical protein
VDTMLPATLETLVGEYINSASSIALQNAVDELILQSTTVEEIDAEKLLAVILDHCLCFFLKGLFFGSFKILQANRLSLEFYLGYFCSMLYITLICECQI